MTKEKGIKTAAIAAGVLLIGGIGYIVYTKYFKRVADIAAPMIETVTEAVEM